MADYLVPMILFVISILSLRKKENTYQILVDGAADGLRLLISIVPSLIILLTAVTMFRSSGAMDAISKLLNPILRLSGIPSETAMLLLIRPFSGSAALAVGAELMAQHGPDSLIGRTAAVMLGSTETTFYTISVYFGAAGIQKTRYTIPAALLADITGFLIASWSVRLFWA